MTKYHAVMLDETGCEFGVDLTASDKADAYEALEENYPESKCVQLESPSDTLRREKAMYKRINDEYEMNGPVDSYDY